MRERHSGLNYIKVLLTLYVVLHHAILAYLPGGPGVLVDDPNNFELWGLLATYFDNFFMYTFFLIAGLFSYASIKRRGTMNYVLNRLIKYGLIFFLGTYLLNTTMLYFKDIVIGTEWWVQYASFEAYFDYVLTVNRIFHPSFHLWFLWLLVIFHIVFAAFYRISPKLFEKSYNLKDPSRILWITYIIMSVGYTGIGIVFGFNFITILGPFSLQISRIIPYFSLFILGILIGKEGINNTFLYPNGEFGRRWKIWLGISIVAPVLLYFLSSFEFEFLDIILLNLTMITALFGAIAYTIIGLRMKNKIKFFEFLAPLALGIYVVHYGFQGIIHGYMLSINISGFIKGILVFFLTMIVSIFVAYVINVLIKNLKKITLNTSQK